MPTKKRTELVSDEIMGKIPPQAKPMEKAILGQIMNEKMAYDRVANLLTAEVFYIDAHQTIFEAMKRLVYNSRPTDLLTVSEELKAMGKLKDIGGDAYLMELTNSVVNSFKIESHAITVYKKYIQREIIQTGQGMQVEAWKEGADVEDVLEAAEKRLFKLSTKINSGQDITILDLLAEAMTNVQKAMANQDKLTGISSGFSRIDKITHGWQNSELVVLAARPAVGKTALALKLARNAAASGTPTLFVSLEMSAGQLMQRLIASESEVALEDIKRGRFTGLDDPKLMQVGVKGVKKLMNMPLHFWDPSSINIFELKSEIRRRKLKDGIAFVIVDYLQLMSGVGSYKGNRESEVSDISRGLKGLAKELNIPIIALSQLSRGVEGRADKTPNLSDLRESGAIEQDADSVIFIYRPEYYSIHADENGQSNAGRTILKWAKNRQGKTDECELLAQLWCQNFVDMPDQRPAAAPKSPFKKKKELGKPSTLWEPTNTPSIEDPVEDKPF